MATIQPYCAKEIFDPPNYTQAIKVTGVQAILFISGQIASDEKGRPTHRGDFVGQARSTLHAIKAQVEAGGGTLANVVKLTTYMTDVRYRADLNQVREEFFGKKIPTSTLVEVSSLAHPDLLIEVEAIAVL